MVKFSFEKPIHRSKGRMEYSQESWVHKLIKYSLSGLSLIQTNIYELPIPEVQYSQPSCKENCGIT